MPRIVPYSKQVAGVQLPRVRRTTRATADQFGAWRGQSIRQLGQLGQVMLATAGEIIEKEELRTQAAQVRTALNKARTEMREYLFGDGTEQNPGLFSRQGESALNVQKEAKERFEEIRMKYADKTWNAAMGEAYEEKMGSLIQSNQGSVDKFHFQERRRYELTSYKVENQNITEDAINHRYEEPVIRQGEQDILDNVAEMYEGAGKKIIERAQKDEIQFYYAQLLEEFENDSPEAAQEFLNKFYDRLAPAIAGKKAAELKRAVKEREILANAKKWSQPGNTLEEALANVDKTYKDPKEYAEARRLVKMRFIERDAINEAKLERNVQMEYVRLGNQKSEYVIPEWVPPRYRPGLRAEQNQIVSGKKIVTDIETWYDLKLMSAKDRNKFAKLNLMAYRHKLDDTDLKSLAGLQAAIIEDRQEAALEGEAFMQFERATKEISDTKKRARLLKRYEAGIKIENLKTRDERQKLLHELLTAGEPVGPEPSRYKVEWETIPAGFIGGEYTTEVRKPKRTLMVDDEYEYEHVVGPEWGAWRGAEVWVKYAEDGSVIDFWDYAGGKFKRYGPQGKPK